MQGELRHYQGSCHCGAVRFAVRTALLPAVRCNCSLCRRKGAVMAAVVIEDFELISGAVRLGLYRFRTHIARHYFCKVCSIYTFHRPRTDSGIYRANVGFLDGVDALTVEVNAHDGAALD